MVLETTTSSLGPEICFGVLLLEERLRGRKEESQRGEIKYFFSLLEFIMTLQGLFFFPILSTFI